MKKYFIAKSRRLRSTPYTDRIEAHGVSGYTVYNHMLLPVSFKSVEADYEHLKKFVQVWDVAAERQVQITGKDSAKLVQLMTCRDLSNSKQQHLLQGRTDEEENDPETINSAQASYHSSSSDSLIHGAHQTGAYNYAAVAAAEQMRGANELLNRYCIEQTIRHLHEFQDARNYHEVTKLYKSINPDVIIHLAAVSHANRSNKNPLLIFFRYFYNSNNIYEYFFFNWYFNINKKN